VGGSGWGQYSDVGEALIDIVRGGGHGSVKDLVFNLKSKNLCLFEIKINVGSRLITSLTNLNIPSIPLEIFECF